MKTWLDSKTKKEIIGRRNLMSNGFTGTISNQNKKEYNTKFILWFIIVTISTGFFLGFGLGLTIAILGVCK